MKRISIIAVIFLSACITRTEKPSAGNAKDAVRDMVFVKHPKAPLCFGLVSSITDGSYRVVSHTVVPCEAVDSLLVK